MLKHCPKCGGEMPGGQLAPAYCPSCMRLYRRAKYAEGPGRTTTLRMRYGITVEEYDARFEDQGGVCAICHVPAEGRLYVDHDHETGEVRGLLCRDCNSALGLLRDDTDRMRSAIKYLEGRS